MTFAYSKYYKISRPQKYLYVWTWLCYGALILIANIVRDVAIFFVHLYVLNPEVMNAERYNSPFLPQTLELTRRTLEKIMREKGQYVSINEVVRTIRDTLGLKSALNEQIFGDGVIDRFD